VTASPTLRLSASPVGCRLGVVKVAVERRSADTDNVSNRLHRVFAAVVHLLGDHKFGGGVSGGGLPPTRPRARAAVSPAMVRSRMRSRSNSASEPKRWNTSLPLEVNDYIVNLAVFERAHDRLEERG
jgi:hypothetical protein